MKLLHYARLRYVTYLPLEKYMQENFLLFKKKGMKLSQHLANILSRRKERESKTKKRNVYTIC